MQNIFFGLFFVVLAVVVQGAVVDWPFRINDDHLLVFDAQIGTPSQKLQLATFHLGFYHPLRVPDANTDGGIFNPKKSSTWNLIGNSIGENNTVDGVKGTDTITIANLLTIKKSQSFEVINEGWLFPGFGTFTFTRSTDKSTAFSAKLLENQKEKIIVLSYDQWKDPAKYSGLTGRFTIGGKPEGRCQDQWTKFQEAIYVDRPFEQWTVNLTQILAGRYHFLAPGQISFQINDPGLGLPDVVFDAVLRSLGSIDYKTVPCSVDSDLIFTLDNNFQINLKAQDYLIKNDDDTCTLRANRLEKGKYGFIFPVYVLRDYCLMLDYENKQIGLAKRT